VGHGDRRTDGRFKLGEDGVARIRLKYVQGFVDRRTGAVFYYFRRAGYRRARLPGIPGSREFVEAYQRALDGPQMSVGASRTKAGSVNAAIVGYYDSSMFFGSLAPSTQAIRRLPRRTRRQADRAAAATVHRADARQVKAERRDRLANSDPPPDAICRSG
jgi:hypothetical protein